MEKELVSIETTGVSDLIVDVDHLCFNPNLQLARLL